MMSAERSRHRFATTRWSLVIAAAGATPASSTALAELCESYWYPAYAYVRRSGYSTDDASDLTQAFFTRVLEKHFLKDAKPERGRFRSFVLASLRHFILNERDWIRRASAAATLRMCHSTSVSPKTVTSASHQIAHAGIDFRAALDARTARSVNGAALRKVRGGRTAGPVRQADAASHRRRALAL